MESKVVIQNEDRKAFIKSCRRQKYKYKNIASLLGISQQRVEQILRPDRHRARAAVNQYFSYSRNCEYPRCSEVGEAHHPDYTRPLDVIWLCKKHHAGLHAVLRNPIKKEKVRKVPVCKRCKIEVPGKYRRVRYCEDCSKIVWREYSRNLYRSSEERRRKHKGYMKKYWDNLPPERVKAFKLKQAEYHKQYYQKKKALQAVEKLTSTA